MFFKGYANDLSFVKFKQVSAAVVFALILLYSRGMQGVWPHQPYRK